MQTIPPEMVSPEQVGFSSKRLTRLDDAMARHIDEEKVAGIVVMLSRRGQVFHVGSYGMADREAGRAMQPDTIFRIWSITKAITTVAALTLYEQGHFTLDQDIASFIPAFREMQVYAGMDGEQMRLVDKERPITIRQLLTHSGGVTSPGANTRPDQMMAEMLGALKQPGTNLAGVVDEIARIPLIAQPNTIWRYGQSFELIARLVEIVSGKTYNAFLRETIFEPLGMADSGYVVNAGQLDRFSAFYAPCEGGPNYGGGLRPTESPSQSRHYSPDGLIDADAYWTPGGHGLVSTPVDIQRFAHMLFNRGTLDGERILAPRTVDLMAANHLTAPLLPYRFPGAQPFYGYGHGLGVHVLMDNGLAGAPCADGEYWKDGGSGTLFWVDPRYELVGVVMYQLDPFWIHNLWAKVKALTYQAMEA